MSDIVEMIYWARVASTSEGSGCDRGRFGGTEQTVTAIIEVRIPHMCGVLLFAMRGAVVLQFAMFLFKKNERIEK